MRKACIFDLDGTLAYTLDSMARPANEVLRGLGLRTLPVENFRFYCGEGADMLVKRCLADAGDQELVHYEEAKRRYRERFAREPLYGVRCYEGMEDALERLKGQGVRLAVCSNKPHEAAVRVVSSLLPSLFDVVIGQQEGIRRKPAPDALLLAAGRLGVSPRECIYFGDSGTDMLTGRGADMLTVGVLWGYRKKEELVEKGAELLLERPEDIPRLYEERKNDQADCQ